MRWLMTQSLLSSWLYQFSTFDEYAEKAHEDFLATLKREPRETSEAAQKGIDFEKLVFDICDGKGNENNKWHDMAKSIASHVVNGQRQYVACKEVVIRDMNVFLYGKIDALKAGTIYDIKFTSHYAVGKFFNSPQHPMYLELIPEAKRFVYLASNGQHTWQEEYRREETRPIIPVIQDFFQYLETNDLLQIYMNNWKTKY